MHSLSNHSNNRSTGQISENAAVNQAPFGTGILPTSLVASGEQDLDFGFSFFPLNPTRPIRDTHQSHHLPFVEPSSTGTGTGTGSASTPIGIGHVSSLELDIIQNALRDAVLKGSPNEIIELAQNAGANCNELNDDHENFLHLAVRAHIHNIPILGPVVQALRQIGVNNTLRNQYSQTPHELGVHLRNYNAMNAKPSSQS